MCTIPSSYNISEIDIVITSEYLNLSAGEFHTYPVVACSGNKDTTYVSILYFGALKYLQYVLISVDSHSLNY
jgi:3'-phosphoadenosine 5'-phosphosulfate sulfotransferase (PAPS reductase)/FAD synthetase